MKRIQLFISIILIAGIFICGKEQKTYKKFSVKEFEKSFVYIPKGTFRVGHDEVDCPVPTRSKLVSVDSFYINKYEVTNGEYLEFINEIKNSGDTSYIALLPDTLQWRELTYYNEPYVEYYFRHPAYSLYPVVCISYEQAIAYCKWLTKKYNNDKNRKYKSAEFLLPTQHQWEYAARGGAENAFPWKGCVLQNEQGKWKANFKIIQQQDLQRITLPVLTIWDTISEKTLISTSLYPYTCYSSSNSIDITYPVKSFWPNDFGIYNMAGNVEEMVREKGITKGGSWNDTGFYLQNEICENYDSTKSASAERGFRIIMRVLEK